MFYDYHMHCNFSADSKTPMEDMITKSIELGLKEICFTDHVDYNITKKHISTIDYNDYFNKLNFFNQKFANKISIKKGLEIGLQTPLLERCSKEIKEHDFDFIIGSIHTIDEFELCTGEYHKGKTQIESYRGYYESLYNIIKDYKDYSVLGHVDLIKRYGGYKNTLGDSLFSDELEAILKQAIYDGKGIEVNTSSFRYNLPDSTPSSYILKLYKSLGGEIITVGSDSHITSQIAHKFDITKELLKKHGYKYICKFDKLKPEFIKV